MRTNICPQGLGSASTVDINSTRVAALMCVDLGTELPTMGMVMHDTVITAWFAPLTLAGGHAALEVRESAPAHRASSCAGGR